MESLQPRAQDLLVATFNVHYLSPRNEEMGWERREAAVLSVLREIDADVFAFQEMETFTGGHVSDANVQLDSIREAFPEFSVAAVGDPRIYPSTQPVAYRRDVLEVIEQGFFFFSATPDAIYSRPWHGGFPAFASWVRFRRLADGVSFYLYNIHADSSSGRNRMKTAHLVTRRIAAREHDDPVILVGDFNAPAVFPSYRVYARADLRGKSVRRSTFHFNRGLHLIPAIDHVLTTGGPEVIAATVVRSQYGGVWPSDHYPVAAVVEMEHRRGAN